MRKRVALCLLSLSVVFLLSVPALAATDQGLTWGVDVNDRHEYSFQYEDVDHPEYSFLHEFYIAVKSLPQIPNNISYASPLNFGVFPELEYYHLNGSEADDWYQHLPPMIIPTGNWTLWTELFEAATSPVEEWDVAVAVEEGPSIWSYTINITVEDHNELGKASYIKESGIILDFLWSAFLDGSKYVEFEVHLLGRLAPEIVIIAVGGGVLVVVGVILLVRKKG
ncbi:MAG: hypothetical protein ACFFAY_03700 [Promethearchaeota archaeon]